jgi:CRISPR/Cas system-associated exonuclease Cas4 (RecB family)
MDPLEHFEFSQSSLQDYVDCARRFQLRYLKRVAWPAAQAEPVRENERHIQRGERFHRLAQQYLLGISAEKLARMAAADVDENLQRWWDNFLGTFAGSLDGTRHVEVTLAAPLAGFRLVAKYDLVLLQDSGRIVIYDWKTSTHRPKRSWLRDRLQTRVYPYLLAEAGAALTGQRLVSPEQVEMVYWFMEPGMDPESFPYSTQQMELDREYLSGLVSELRAPGKEYEMAASQAACKFCVYRSLCNRGVQAGVLGGEEDEPDWAPGDPNRLDFDLEQINEISF